MLTRSFIFAFHPPMAPPLLLPAISSLSVSPPWWQGMRAHEGEVRVVAPVAAVVVVVAAAAAPKVPVMVEVEGGLEVEKV